MKTFVKSSFTKILSIYSELKFLVLIIKSILKLPSKFITAVLATFVMSNILVGKNGSTKIWSVALTQTDGEPPQTV